MSDDRPRDLFLEAVRSHADARFDAKRFEGLLKDFYQGNFRKESAVLSNCVREGVPDALASVKGGIPYAVASAPLTRKLVDNWGTTEELAQWAVDSWALALGIVTESDLRPRGQFLSIESAPSGATAMVDGQVVGTTPVEVKSIAQGAHRVECTKDGYLAATASVTVAAGEHAQVSLTLEKPAPAAQPAKDTSTFVVTSLPSDAEIYIDNQRVGRTPLSITGVLPGSHVIRCSLPGYNDQSITSFIRALEEKHHTLTLSPLMKDTAEITIQTTPSGCAIHLDGVYCGLSPLRLEDVTPGDRAIRATRTGHEDEQRQVNVTRGEKRTLYISLKAIGRSRAALSISSRPSGATLYVNEKRMGQTPITVNVAGPGSISVTCTHPGYRTWHQDIPVKATSPNSLTINLVSEVAPLSRSPKERKLPPLMPRPMAINGVCVLTSLLSLLYASFATTVPPFILFTLWGLFGTHQLFHMKRIGLQLIASWAAILIVILSLILSAQSTATSSTSFSIFTILILGGILLVLGNYRSYFIE